MTDPIADDIRRALGRTLRTSEAMRAFGVTDHRQVESAPGPAGWLTRLAAFFAEGEVCPCGGEHIPSDHNDKTDGPLP